MESLNDADGAAVQAQRPGLPMPSRGTAVVLAAYYVLLIAGSLLVATVVVTGEFEAGPIPLAVYGGLAMAVGGSSIYYMRRLYKWLLSDAEPGDSRDPSALAAVLYFATRPLFSAFFAVLVAVGLLAGLLTISGPLEPNEGFVYLTMFLSFLIGFSAGRVIDRLESLGESVVARLFPAGGRNE